MVNSSSCTGFAGGGDVTGESNTNGSGACTTTPTPEPGTLSLAVPGVVGLLIAGLLI